MNTSSHAYRTITSNIIQSNKRNILFSDITMAKKDNTCRNKIRFPFNFKEHSSVKANEYIWHLMNE